MHALNCKYCHTPFTAKYKTRKFCSRSCHIANNNVKREWKDESRNAISVKNKGTLAGKRNPNYSAAFEIFNCLNCDSQFTVPLNALRAKKHSGKYCSRSCRLEYDSRHRMSPIQKRLYKIWGRNVHKSVSKKSHWIKWTAILGYTLDDLMKHLERRFKPGMTWDNYGRFGWHIDHKKPVSSFNFTSENDTQFKECWSLNNLQPLWWKENISKGGKNRITTSCESIT